jgi:hypothetical protein
MHPKTDAALFWAAAAVGGLLLGLSHSPARSLLGDWIGAFGITGSLCTMLTDKIGSYRPFQDTERGPRSPLGDQQ